MATNYRIDLQHGLPYHLAARKLIRTFCRETGDIVAEARRRTYYESQRDEKIRKCLEEQREDRRAERRASRMIEE